jgi:hypothetical protein
MFVLGFWFDVDTKLNGGCDSRVSGSYLEVAKKNLPLAQPFENRIFTLNTKKLNLLKQLTSHHGTDRNN